MAKLVLYRAIASPPARSVMMLGDLLNLQFEYREVKMTELEHKSEKFKQTINPMGTVPVLQDGNFILAESHAILKYLTECYGGEQREQLYPSHVQSRAIVDQCMFFNSGFFFPKMAAAAIPLLLHGVKDASPNVRVNIEEAYGVINEYLRNRRFVAAEHLTLADLSVGSTATATEPFLEIDQNKFPRLAEWMKVIQEIPCFKTVNAEGVAYFKKFIARARAAHN